MSYLRLTVCTVALNTIVHLQSSAHCQIPCGIYDDQMRIHQMKEHVRTIEKSMKQLAEEQNDNQTVRWVMNKEWHADELNRIVTFYFMAQRIKPSMENYVQNLTVLHKILAISVEAKQTTDLGLIAKLNRLIRDFEHSSLADKR